MMAETNYLPEAFSDLEKFLEQWALRGQRARYGKMLEAGMPLLTEFYEAMMPRLDAIISHLNQFDLEALPEPEQHLMDLALTFAETAHPVDFKWKHTQFDDVLPFERVLLLSASQAW